MLNPFCSVEPSSLWTTLTDACFIQIFDFPTSAKRYSGQRSEVVNALYLPAQKTCNKPRGRVHEAGSS